ncbi:13270_t:CDS:2 [Dentiscutata heterogama]|uniref:13270_t:CDS:1 n=1 Tax=Dentiscutata heterogama TaxID=1316150 RepID=A0ACA9JVG7_9GLOM|nr:13270_t:CDS:2 [Dentiscutata heterogama]
MSDPKVSTLWQDIEYEKKLNTVRTEGILQAAITTTDEVISAINTTNAIHQYNLRSLVLAKKVIQKSIMNQNQNLQNEINSSTISTIVKRDLPATFKEFGENEIDVSTNDEKKFSEICREVNENEMELDLQEPSVVYITENNLEDLDWEVVMHKVEVYRKQPKKSICLRSSLLLFDRSNKEKDPNVRARIEFKVDAAIEYQTPVIGCLEVPDAEDQLKGHEIRVYAFAASGSLFHLVLMYEAFLPSSREDFYNLELTYLALKEYKRNWTKQKLCYVNSVGRRYS